jgi:hypothetical protein
MEDWFMAMTAGGNKEAHSLAILTVWHIWKERNARVFNKSSSGEQSVFTRIKENALTGLLREGGDLVSQGLF